MTLCLSQVLGSSVMQLKRDAKRQAAIAALQVLEAAAPRAEQHTVAEGGHRHSAGLITTLCLTTSVCVIYLVCCCRAGGN